MKCWFKPRTFPRVISSGLVCSPSIITHYYYLSLWFGFVIFQFFGVFQFFTYYLHVHNVHIVLEMTLRNSQAYIYHLLYPPYTNHSGTRAPHNTSQHLSAQLPPPPPVFSCVFAFGLIVCVQFFAVCMYNELIRFCVCFRYYFWLELYLK